MWTGLYTVGGETDEADAARMSRPSSHTDNTHTVWQTKTTEHPGTTHLPQLHQTAHQQKEAERLDSDVYFLRTGSVLHDCLIVKRMLAHYAYFLCQSFGGFKAKGYRVHK